MGYISCGDFMKGKLIRDRRFNPSYTREEATRIYHIAYRKYSRGYVRASTEKMLYMADKCFWQQFWPTDEFPGEKAWILRETTEEEAMNEYENTATQIKRQLKQEGTRYLQNATALPWAHTFSNQDEKAQVLVKHPFDISTPRGESQTLQKTPDQVQLEQSSPQLQGASSISTLTATNIRQEDLSTYRESQHSLGVAQLAAVSSANLLQTLDEMIEEEGRIARQLV